jgi:CRISPR-associated protein Cas8b/Csh1 subtype I-B
MSEPDRNDFAEAIEEYWHGRPPASLEDVMALYGVLAVAESSGALFGSPNTLHDGFVDDGYLVRIDIDLTEQAASSPYEKIKIDTLRAEDVPKLAYAHKSSGRGAKYSVTQIGSKSGNDAEGVANTILGKLSSWTTQHSVRSVTGEGGHPDGWIIERLAEIFAKDSDTIADIRSEIESVFPADDSIPTAMTVRCRINGAKLEASDTDEIDWFWPADLDVLDAAMRRYSTVNATNKNIKPRTSEGEAIDAVSGRRGRVVGTPESPMEVFSVKHPDAQPGLDQEQSWRNYPISETAAMLFSKGAGLVDRCALRRGGTETYTLPYFAGELTAEKAEALYGAIQSLDSETDYTGTTQAPMARVTYKLRESESERVRDMAKRELRFYMLSLPISDDKNVIAEEPAATVYYVNELAEALVDTIHGPTLDRLAGGFAAYEDWQLLDLRFIEDRDRARNLAFGRIVGHTFTDEAFAHRDDEGDDFRRIVDHRLIAGERLPASMLFDEYMRRHAGYIASPSNDATGDDELPAPLVAQQLVHLESLSRAGLLEGLNAPVEPATHDTDTMTPDIEDTDIDRSDIAAIREHRLESFLDRPLFTDNERRAAALVGVLVGEVSWHQEDKRNMGRPLDSKTRGDQLTKNGLEHAVMVALDRAKVYAFDSDRSFERDILFPETVDRLLETTDRMPTEWGIEKRDLQFAYSLGHAHGRRSMPIAFDLRESDEENEGSDEQVEPTAD